MNIKERSNEELISKRKSLILRVAVATTDNNIPHYILYKDELNCISRELIGRKVLD